MPDGLPLAVSHKWALLSQQAVRTTLPSGLKTAEETKWRWRKGEPTGLPLASSHICAVLSSFGVRRVLPSGLKTKEGLYPPGCGIECPMGRPEVASHRPMILAWRQAVRAILLSGLKATPRTSAGHWKGCPMGLPVAASHSRALP